MILVLLLYVLRDRVLARPRPLLQCGDRLPDHLRLGLGLGLGSNVRVLLGSRFHIPKPHNRGNEAKIPFNAMLTSMYGGWEGGDRGFRGFFSLGSFGARCFFGLAVAVPSAGAWFSAAGSAAGAVPPPPLVASSVAMEGDRSEQLRDGVRVRVRVGAS